jgi:hypothetical protein
MAQYAIIENGVCLNTVVCDPDSADAGWILLTDNNSGFAGPGATYDSSTDTFTAAVVSYTAEELTEMSKEALMSSDWTQLPDVGLTADSVINWRTYRATLREIKDGDKGWSDWPEQPEKEYV